VRLIWSVANAADFYCEQELRQFEQAPWFIMTTAVDAPGDAVNAAVRVVERDGLPPEDATIVLCGGPGFVSSVADALASRGVARERMRSDMFTYESKSGV
jgi:NAD(P)H-flavin reductase